LSLRDFPVLVIKLNLATVGGNISRVRRIWSGSFGVGCKWMESLVDVFFVLESAFGVWSGRLLRETTEHAEGTERFWVWFGVVRFFLAEKRSTILFVGFFIC
jgi:hypothetical protein